MGVDPTIPIRVFLYKFFCLFCLSTSKSTKLINIKSFTWRSIKFYTIGFF